LQTDVNVQLSELQQWERGTSAFAAKARTFRDDWMLAGWVCHQNTALGHTPSYGDVFARKRILDNTDDQHMLLQNKAANRSERQWIRRFRRRFGKRAIIITKANENAQTVRQQATKDGSANCIVQLSFVVKISTYFSPHFRTQIWAQNVDHNMKVVRKTWST
jgi:hypothetical protein